MSDLHNAILHVQVNCRTLNICSKTPAGAEHILSSVYTCIYNFGDSILTNIYSSLSISLVSRTDFFLLLIGVYCILSSPPSQLAIA